LCSFCRYDYCLTFVGSMPLARNTKPILPEFVRSYGHASSDSKQRSEVPSRHMLGGHWHSGTHIRLHMPEADSGFSHWKGQAVPQLLQTRSPGHEGVSDTGRAILFCGSFIILGSKRVGLGRISLSSKAQSSNESRHLFVDSCSHLFLGHWHSETHIWMHMPLPDPGWEQTLGQAVPQDFHVVSPGHSWGSDRSPSKSCWPAAQDSSVATTLRA